VFSTREFHSPPPSLPHPPSTSRLAFPRPKSARVFVFVFVPVPVSVVVSRTSSRPSRHVNHARIIITTLPLPPSSLTRRVHHRLSPRRPSSRPRSRPASRLRRLASPSVSSLFHSREPLERSLASRRESIHRSIGTRVSSTTRRETSVGRRARTDRSIDQSLNQSIIHPAHPSIRPVAMTSLTRVHPSSSSSFASFTHLASRHHRARSLARSIGRSSRDTTSRASRSRTFARSHSSIRVIHHSSSSSSSSWVRR